MIEETLLEAEEKMEKALVAAKNELASIRTGRANPALFTSLSVEYYGAPTPLQQLASVTVPEPPPRTLSPPCVSQTWALTPPTTVTSSVLTYRL